MTILCNLNPYMLIAMTILCYLNPYMLIAMTILCYLNYICVPIYAHSNDYSL